MKPKLKTILVSTLILIAFGLPAVHAQRESSVRLQGVVAGHPQFETFVSTVRTNFALAENQTGSSLGLRGSYAFTNRFALEGSVNKLENSFTFGAAASWPRT